MDASGCGRDAGLPHENQPAKREIERGRFGNDLAKHKDERLSHVNPSGIPGNGARKHGDGAGILVFGRRILVDGRISERGRERARA